MKEFLKTDQLFNSTSLFTAGVSLIIIGILMIVGKNQLYFNVGNLFISAILIFGVLQFVRYFFLKLRPNEKKITFTRSFAYLLFCLILSSFRKIPLSILPILFAVYMILNGGIKFINYFILRSSHANGRLFQLFLAFVYFVIGFPLLFSPLKNINTMLILLGTYTILLGVTCLMDALSVLMPIKIKKRIRRRFRVTLPVIFEALLPYRVLQEINYYWDKETFDQPLVYEDKKGNEKPDLEVFVHVAPHGYNRFGHVDVCINGKVISYGAYDDSTLKWFNMIGDGVIFEVDRNKYVHYCSTYSDKTLFCFGIRLSKLQRERVENEIKKIMSNVYPFETQYEKDNKIKKRGRRKKYEDYPSKLSSLAGAKFYKVKSGSFKTFFILSTNCCMLADNIIGKSGIDLLKMTGIITPGTYYEYLNQEFHKKNGIVISKIIYNNESVKKRKVFSSGSLIEKRKN